ncbi:beta-1,3-galactosyltransferase brn-like [Daktulosphaira vitifoliae]|uniref:beta-1,3-galactosyltransferase brn-like n=1 Tax=Daktulosphaira vitifoliae TaxID=58002 RepID=UPI0021A9C201|nr:beta-1,3-galactosyltransferase brn-like [Daktulosphaira vitifoliae]
MYLSDMTRPIYYLIQIKKYLKYIFIIVLWLMYYFGIFTHFFELDYYKHFSYPLETDITKCILNLKGILPDQLSCEIINPYDFNLLLTTNKCDQNIQLLILVKSALNNFEKRASIRKTWGFENRFSDKPTRTIFILGTTYELNLQKLIQIEHENYGDIVQYSFVDNYYNNTLKTLGAITWASTYCRNSSYYFFSDDDMYVSIKNLFQYLQNPFEYPNNIINEVKNSQSIQKISETLFSGYVFNSSPLRHQISKWYVSLFEYPYHMWPPYVTAGAYVMSHTALIDFHYASFFTKRFRFDDIYLGLIAKKLNITPLHCEHIYFYKKYYSIKNYKYVIASHGYDNSNELLNVWLEQKSFGNA